MWIKEYFFLSMLGSNSELLNIDYRNKYYNNKICGMSRYPNLNNSYPLKPSIFIPFYLQTFVITVQSKVDIFITVATPQDNIIEALEAEIIRLKTELTHTEDRLSEMRKKLDDMAIKLYGGARNQVVGVPRLIYLLLWLNGIKHSKRYIANLCLNGHGDVNTNTPLGQWWLFIQYSLRNILIRYVGTGLSLQRVPLVSGRGKLIHLAALCG